MIDGKAMKFDTKAKKWEADDNPPEHIQALLTTSKPAAAPTEPPPKTVHFDEEDSLNSARRRMANASKTIQATLAGLTNSI